MPYIELQTISNFSFLRGGSHPDELAQEAARLGYPAFGLCDLHSVAGIVRAHMAAKEAGIRLIVGAAVIPRKDLIGEEPPFLPLHILLYPTSKAAYGRLCTLLTRGKFRAPKGDCWLLLEDLADYAEGIIAICAVDPFHAPELIKPSVEILKDIFTDRLSLAINTSYGPKQHQRLEFVAKLGNELKIPLVVTNDVYYHSPERRKLQDALTCIRLGCTIKEAGFALLANAERHLKPPAEMERLFKKFPAAISRSGEIAKRALEFSLDQLKYEYPHEICPVGRTPQEYLRALTLEGAKQRYPGGLPKAVALQIKHELELIRELNYEKYFLTCYDIVRFAREKNILCQGRGAAANSAVCYVLGITAVDPTQVQLLFERFISKERNEPPDIDIDFEHERREEVIQYIYEKYGRTRAALVSEVISYRTRSAFRDISKVFGLSAEVSELLVKLKTRSEHGQIDPDKLLEHGIDPSDIDIRHTIELSQVIRSFPRHLSQHVGGFIISDPPLCEIVPIENATMEHRTVIEWDKDDIENMGMLKIDVLGLGMLTCIRKAIELLNISLDENSVTAYRQLIKPLTHPWPMDLYNIPREDKAVYDMASAGDTVGVFQIESRAQMSMLPRLRPQCFYDLVVEVAIVRPGPIQGGMVHPYLRRRSGKERVSYPDERVKRILERTLGVPIFQEQVMQLAIVAAGFTPGEADALRRAMGSWKRNANRLLSFRNKVLDGMRRNKYPAEFAERLFEQMKGFGEYGFPQSHAASFALLVYVSAWLKCHYPAVFAAGLLNSQPMGFYQPAQLIEDAKRHNVIVLGVDVNFSAWDCTLEGNSYRLGTPDLRLGMRLVRGMSKAEAEKLVAARKLCGRFRSLLQLWRESGVKVSQLKLLAKADAFQSLGLNRQQALWQIKKLRDDHLPLFDGEEEKEPEVKLPEISAKLQVLRDYQTLGLSLKAHPLSFLRNYLLSHGVLTAKELKDSDIAANHSRQVVAGLVLVRQRPPTASGMLFMTIEDETGLMNLIVKPPVQARYQDALLDGVFVLVSGKVQRQDEVLHLLVEEAMDISRFFEEMDSASRDFR